MLVRGIRPNWAVDLIAVLEHAVRTPPPDDGRGRAASDPVPVSDPLEATSSMSRRWTSPLPYAIRSSGHKAAWVTPYSVC
jgi:hypothetical protein